MNFLEDSIFHLLTCTRVSNDPAKSIPQYYPNGIYLPYYCCIIVGKRGGYVDVETFYIQKQIQIGLTHHILIEWYPFQEFDQTPVRFWVNAEATLKKRIFRFEDFISFRRCTFLYLPEIGLTRLSMIPVIHIPPAMATSFTIVKDYQLVIEKENPPDSSNKLPPTFSSLNAQTLHSLQNFKKEMNSPFLTPEQKEELKQEIARFLL